MSKLRASTLRCALSIERVTMPCSIASPSGILRRSMIAFRCGRRRRCAAAGPPSTGRSATPGIALAARAAAQLVVDAARLVALGADDVQAAGADDLVVQRLPLAPQLRRPLLLPRRIVERLVGFDELHLLLDVAAEHDVGAAARHVGGDRDHARRAGLRDDLGLRACCLAFSTWCGSPPASAGPRATRSSRSTSCRPAPAGRVRGSP